MKQAADTSTTKRGQQPQTKDSPIKGMVVAMQLLDTSWRVALPILVLSIAGVRLDRHYGSSPLFMVSGLIVALAISTILVYKQIARAYPDFFVKKGGRS